MVRSAIEKVERLMQNTLTPLAINAILLNSSSDTLQWNTTGVTNHPMNSLTVNETTFLLLNESVFGGGAETIFFDGLFLISYYLKKISKTYIIRI